MNGYFPVQLHAKPAFLHEPKDFESPKPSIHSLQITKSLCCSRLSMPNLQNQRRFLSLLAANNQTLIFPLDWLNGWAHKEGMKSGFTTIPTQGTLLQVCDGHSSSKLLARSHVLISTRIFWFLVANQMTGESSTCNVWERERERDFVWIIFNICQKEITRINRKITKRQNKTFTYS